MDGISINTNIAAIFANRYAEQTKLRVATARLHLSAGLRIISAKEDASGLSIANRLEGSLTTLRQGVQNSLDGVSMLQVMTGALSEYLKKLHTLSILAADASSETITDLERKALKA